MKRIFSALKFKTEVKHSFLEARCRKWDKTGLFEFFYSSMLFSKWAPTLSWEKTFVIGSKSLYEKVEGMTSSQGTRKRISSPFLRDILFLFLRAFNALFIHASQSKLTFVPCFHSEQRKTCSSFRFFMSQKKWETRKRNHNHHVVVCDKYFYKYLWLR